MVLPEMVEHLGAVSCQAVQVGPANRARNGYILIKINYVTPALL
jgi:hypothetical protein